jgi:hypothetical protein
MLFSYSVGNILIFLTLVPSDLYDNYEEFVPACICFILFLIIKLTKRKYQLKLFQYLFSGKKK